MFTDDFCLLYQPWNKKTVYGVTVLFPSKETQTCLLARGTVASEFNNLLGLGGCRAYQSLREGWSLSPIFAMNL